MRILLAGLAVLASCAPVSEQLSRRVCGGFQEIAEIELATRAPPNTARIFLGSNPDGEGCFLLSLGTRALGNLDTGHKSVAVVRDGAVRRAEPYEGGYIEVDLRKRHLHHRRMQTAYG